MIYGLVLINDIVHRTFLLAIASLAACTWRKNRCFAAQMVSNNMASVHPAGSPAHRRRVQGSIYTSKYVVYTFSPSETWNLLKYHGWCDDVAMWYSTNRTPPDVRNNTRPPRRDTRMVNTVKYEQGSCRGPKRMRCLLIFEGSSDWYSWLHCNTRQ